MAFEQKIELEPQIKEQGLTALEALERHFNLKFGRVIKMEGDLKFCVVCGEGSHREDWKAPGVVPACDSHSKAEVAAAVKAKTPAATAPSK